MIERSRARAHEQMDLISDLLELGQPAGARLAAEVRTRPAWPGADGRFGNHSAMCHSKGPCGQSGDISRPSTGDGLPARFKSVWANLIGNAVKYTAEGGRVDVRLREEDGWVIGQVSDSGIGIPQENQNRVFTEFFRADNAKALEIPGTGLGLAIVKKIIEDAGGEISFVSEPGPRNPLYVFFARRAAGTT